MCCNAWTTALRWHCLRKSCARSRQTACWFCACRMVQLDGGFSSAKLPIASECLLRGGYLPVIITEHLANGSGCSSPWDFNQAWTGRAKTFPIRWFGQKRHKLKHGPSIPHNVSSFQTEQFAMDAELSNF